VLEVIEVIVAPVRFLSHQSTSQAYVVDCSVGTVPTKSQLDTGTLSILFTTTFAVQVFPAASTKFIVSLPFAV